MINYRHSLDLTCDLELFSLQTSQFKDKHIYECLKIYLSTPSYYAISTYFHDDRDKVKSLDSIILYI